MTKVKVGAGIQFAAVLIADVLNPLFVMSLAVFASVGYLLSLLMPVDIEMWRGLFWVSLIVPGLGLLAGFYARWKRGGPIIKGRVSWRMLLPLAPMMVMAPIIWAEFAHPTMQVLHHANVHVGYIHQLLYGATPVENVFVAGHPVNYYWLYHAYLAAIVKITSFSPPTVSSLVNVAAIFSSFVWISQILKVLKLGRPRTVHWGLMILLVCFSVNITSILSVLGHALNGTYAPYAYDIMLLDGASPSLHSVLGKALNFTSMTLGIMLFNAALYACIKLVKLDIGLDVLILLSAAGIAALAVREIAALHMVVALLGGIMALAGHHCWRCRGKRGQLRLFWQDLTDKAPPTALLLWLAVSLALSLLLVKYNLDIAGSFQLGRPFGRPNAVNIGMITAAVILFIPLCLLQGLFVWRQRNRIETFLLLGALFSASLTSVLYLPDRNQEKGIYFLAILMALSGLLVLQRLQNSGIGWWRRSGRLLSAFYFALVMAQTFYVASGFIGRVQMLDEGGYRLPGIYFHGIHIENSEDIDQSMAAYYWIRDHTAPHAIVVLPLIPSIHSNLYHERLMYVRQLQLHFSASALGYHQRVHDLDLFYSEETAADDYQRLLARMMDSLPGRPLYAVVKDEEVSPQVMRRRGARLVYEDEDDGANVYWLNPKGDR